MTNFFKDFDIYFLKTKKGNIRYRKAGNGPAILMLHGNPQTHVMWHKVAPELVKNFTIICPDIPGYGQSFKPKITIAEGIPKLVEWYKDFYGYS